MIKVRFAPSPTGYLHIGNFRTALVNFLFARNVNGHFMLRIDDTDQERSSLEYEEAIKEDLSWRSINWDSLEKQSSRLSNYDDALETLLDKKRAKTGQKGIANILFDFKNKDQGNQVEITVGYNSKKRKLNFKVPILKPEENIYLKLLPEGGNLISGLTNNVAFKATDLEGNPLTIEGGIYENNKRILNINSIYDGMGSFLLKPKKGKLYTVKITKPKLDSIFKFPVIKE